MIFNLTTFRPYYERSQIRLEVANEFWLMVLTDLMFLFTKPADKKYEFGYGYITVFIFGYVANIVYVAFTYLSAMKNKAKKVSISIMTKSKLKRDHSLEKRNKISISPEPLPEPEPS